MRKSAIIGLVLAILCMAGCTRKFFREFTDRQVEEILNEKNQFPQWAIEGFHVYPDPRARFADPDDPDHPHRPPDDPAADLLSPNPQPGKKVGVGFYEGQVYLKYLAEWDALNRTEQPQSDDVEQEETSSAEVGPSVPTPAPLPDLEPDLPEPRAVPGAAQGVPPGSGASKAGESMAGDSEPATGDAGESDTDDAEAAGTSGDGETDPGGDNTFETVLASDESPYLIKLEQAVELAQFNSRDLQIRREDLYGSALPVTLERFAFSTQFFALGALIRESTGSRTLTGRRNRWRLDSEGGFSKLFPTGAMLLFRLANQLVIDLGRGRTEVGISNLSLELTQPLLQGGGFAVNLEPLTQSERTLLYAIRSYARFRKLFYVALVSGGGTFNNPFGLTGLSLRGVGPGLDSPGQGYLPTLLNTAIVRNIEANVRELEQILELFQALIPGGDISKLEAGQVEQSLLGSRNNLLGQRLQLQDALDLFKIQLGIPTNLPLELDDTPIRPLNQQLRRFEQISEESKQLQVELTKLELLPPRQLRAGIRRSFRDAALLQDTPFLERFLDEWQTVQSLRPSELLERSKRLGTELRDAFLEADRYEGANQPVPEELQERILSIERARAVTDLELGVRDYETLGAPSPSRFRILYRILLELLEEAQQERLAKVREAWPELPRICLDGIDLLAVDLDRAQTVVAQTALSNRLDLMNARAELVDAWRGIKVTANSLLGVLNIGYNLDSATPIGLNRPFAFSGSRTGHRLTINGELPLIRRAERNTYRTALIGYQRARRDVQASEDFILQQVRSEIRQLRVLAENYKIQQRAVELAYLQLENALNRFSAPLPPEQRLDAAGLTQQLLNVTSSLPNSQNALYSIWIDFLTTRLELYRDLELMPLDARGVWLYEYAVDGLPAADQPQSGTGTDARLPQPTDRDAAEPSDPGDEQRPRRASNPAQR